MTRKNDINSIRKKGLENYGFILLSTEYNGTHEPLKWKHAKTGVIIERSWSTLIRGNVGTRKVNNYEKDKDTINSYKNLGYHLKMTEDEYLSAKRTNDYKRIFIVTNSKLIDEWHTTMSNFKSNAESYLNTSGKSMGEALVSTALTENGIYYETHLLVKIGSDNHLFDFYLPDYNIVIEYDGKQHFQKVPSWGGEKAHKIQSSRDEAKNKYCLDKGITLIRIPYTVNTIGDVTQYLATAMNKN